MATIVMFHKKKYDNYPLNAMGKLETQISYLLFNGKGKLYLDEVCTLEL